MSANLILIDLKDGPNQWRLKMFEGQRCVGEATCPPMDRQDTEAALDGWRAERVWARRAEFLPRKTK